MLPWPLTRPKGAGNRSSRISGWRANLEVEKLSVRAFRPDGDVSTVADGELVNADDETSVSFLAHLERGEDPTLITVRLTLENTDEVQVERPECIRERGGQENSYRCSATIGDKLTTAGRWSIEAMYDQEPKPPLRFQRFVLPPQS